MGKDGSVSEPKGLLEAFEESRGHLRGVAYRMLGSLSEADDAVQEAWLRLNRADVSEVENLRGWLTTVVARVCLDMLRGRKSRREEPFAGEMAEAVANRAGGTMNPEQEALLADIGWVGTVGGAGSAGASGTAGLCFARHIWSAVR